MSLPKLNTPIYELVLPSSNKHIKFRPFLVKEYKTLLMLKDANDSEAINIIEDLVDVCTFNKLNIIELPSFDLEYIFLNIRAKSVGESIDLFVKCECGNNIEYSLNILNLNVKKEENHTTRIMIDDSIGIEMRYPRFKDTMSTYTNKNDTDSMNMVFNSVKAVYTADEYTEITVDNRKELEELIYSMTNEQFAKIEEFFEKMPKLIHEDDVACTKCTAINHVRLEGLQNFFV
jgi:hypothetical protein